MEQVSDDMSEREVWPGGWNPHVPASIRARWESGDQETRVSVKAENIGLTLLPVHDDDPYDSRDSEGNPLYKLVGVQFGPATLGECEEWLAHET